VKSSSRSSSARTRSPAVPPADDYIQLACQCPLQARNRSAASLASAERAQVAQARVQARNSEMRKPATHSASARRFSAPQALPSRHDFPSTGNWIRLSAAQQVRPGQMSARRETSAAPRGTFGAQPRHSPSNRWSYQTALPFTRKQVGASETDISATPGSFLSLQPCLPKSHRAPSSESGHAHLYAAGSSTVAPSRPGVSPRVSSATRRTATSSQLKPTPMRSHSGAELDERAAHAKGKPT